jgi:PAS domain-containing protein
MDDVETRLLDELYRSPIDEGALKNALELVQSMFNCRAAAFVAFDRQAPPTTDIALTSGVFNEFKRLYLEQFAGIDPAPAMFASLPPGTASTSDRLISAERRRTDPFVQEFFRPAGLVETLGGTLFRDQARFSLIGLQRGNDREPFQDSDIIKLERLMPHMKRALQLRRAFLRVEAKGLALEAILDRLPAGVIVLDAEGEAIFENAAMQLIAQAADGLARDRQGRPLPANAQARRRCRELLLDVVSGGAGGMLTAPRPSGERDYVLLFAPAKSMIAELTDKHQRRTGVIVLVHDPASRPPNRSEVLEQALHLPKHAARLVAALVADDDPISYAARQGVTVHTARYHLHTALTRTGTRTQLELVRLALRVLRDVTPFKDE